MLGRIGRGESCGIGRGRVLGGWTAGDGVGAATAEQREPRQLGPVVSCRTTCGGRGAEVRGVALGLRGDRAILSTCGYVVHTRDTNVEERLRQANSAAQNCISKYSSPQKRSRRITRPHVLGTSAVQVSLERTN